MTNCLQEAQPLTAKVTATATQRWLSIPPKVLTRIWPSCHIPRTRRLSVEAGPETIRTQDVMESADKIAQAETATISIIKTKQTLTCKAKAQTLNASIWFRGPQINPREWAEALRQLQSRMRWGIHKLRIQLSPLVKDGVATRPGTVIKIRSWWARAITKISIPTLWTSTTNSRTAGIMVPLQKRERWTR